MNLRNLTSRSIMVKVKSIVAQVATANVVPSILTPKISQESEENEDKRMKSPDMSSEARTRTQLTNEQLKKMFDKLDLSGIEDLSNGDQEEVLKPIKDFGFPFILNDSDLGKTSIVKHTIKLTDYTPFRQSTIEFHHINLERLGNIHKKCWR